MRELRISGSTGSALTETGHKCPAIVWKEVSGVTDESVRISKQ